MILLDTLTFKRNIYGWLEETNLSIYEYWEHGFRFYVVHAHNGDDNCVMHARTQGHYVCSHLNLIQYMEYYLSSWFTGNEHTDPTIYYHTRMEASGLIDATFNFDPEHPYAYRVLLRSEYWDFMDERMSIVLSATTRKPIIRSVAGQRSMNSAIFNKECAERLAINLVSCPIEQPWHEDIRKHLTKPKAVIQRARYANIFAPWTNNNLWEDVNVYSFLTIDRVRRFSKDFTRLVHE